MQLCIDFGGTEIKTGIVRDGTPLAVDVLPVAGTAEDLVRAAAAADELIARVGAVTAVGIAVPGVVDRRTGRMLHANAKYGYLRDGGSEPSSAGVDLAAWARERFGAPAIIENDARAALAGEMASGVATGERDVVLVTLGTGIGTAAAMDGRLLWGAHDHAGILGGHVTTDVHAPLCPCGNVGCGESLASTRALRERRPDLAGMDALVTLSTTDAAASALFQDFLQVWGATIVTLCHMYDPDLVVLSGGVLRAGARIADPLREHVHRHLWPSSHRPPLVVAMQPELSVLRGLAVLSASASATAKENVR